MSTSSCDVRHKSLLISVAVVIDLHDHPANTIGTPAGCATEPATVGQA
ncbi:hypothetical protein [Streptomyces hirsutus]